MLCIAANRQHGRPNLPAFESGCGLRQNRLVKLKAVEIGAKFGGDQALGRVHLKPIGHQLAAVGGTAVPAFRTEEDYITGFAGDVLGADALAVNIAFWRTSAAMTAENKRSGANLFVQIPQEEISDTDIDGDFHLWFAHHLGGHGERLPISVQLLVGATEASNPDSQADDRAIVDVDRLGDLDQACSIDIGEKGRDAAQGIVDAPVEKAATAAVTIIAGGYGHQLFNGGTQFGNLRGVEHRRQKGVAILLHCPLRAGQGRVGNDSALLIG